MFKQLINIMICSLNLVLLLLLLSDVSIAQTCFSDADCDDGNVCTDDYCDSRRHRCSHEFNSSSCDDGIYCNGDDDTCHNGSCSMYSANPCPGVSSCDEQINQCLCNSNVDCDDYNDCTSDVCGRFPPDLHVCSNIPLTGTPCDDRYWCNGEDTCGDDGNCSVHEGNPCPAGTTCIEGRGCNTPTGCQTDEECDDGSPCTVADCWIHDGESFCFYSAIDASCDDGIHCNGEDICEHGMCVHSGNPCEPHEVCIEEMYGSCALACLVDEDCIDDGIACIASVCGDGGYCDERAITGPCDDGLYCNGDDSCSGQGAGCVIHEGNPCPIGTLCDEETNNCRVVGCTSNGECDDGIFCNGDETCIGGFCNSGVNPCNEEEECDEENDECLGVPQPLSCEIAIEPGRAEVFSEMVMNFTVTNTGDCNDPEYEWFVLGTIKSSIDQNGNYTAGINRNFFKEAVDLVRVVDHANSDIIAEAVLIVSFRSCVLIPLYGESSREVAVLRRFKDEILNKTPEGRELIKLYYFWSPSMVGAVEEDDTFRDAITEMIDGILPLVEKVIE